MIRASATALVEALDLRPSGLNTGCKPDHTLEDCHDRGDAGHERKQSNAPLVSQCCGGLVLTCEAAS